MSTNTTSVTDLRAYEDGFNKGIELIEKHKKLLSVTASFIKSLMYKEYSKSFTQGVVDGWDFGFRKQKEILQEQARQRFEERQQQEASEREVHTQQAPKEVIQQRNQQHNKKLQERQTQMQQQQPDRDKDIDR